MNFIVLAIGLCAVACSVVLIAVIHRSLLRWIGGVTEWGWACALLILASYLFGEGDTRSVGMVRLIANLALFGAVYLMNVSLRKFAGMAPAPRALGASVALAAIVLVALDGSDAGYTSRAVCVLIAHLLLFCACATTMLRMRARQFPEFLALGLFVTLALLSALRLLALATGSERSDILQGSSLYQRAYLAAFATSMVVLMIAYMLLVGTRLAQVLRRVATSGSFERLSNVDRAKIAIDLNGAAARAELVLHYQPRVCVRTQQIIGVEALVRWNRSQFGLLHPDQFIAIAEETGAIIPIGIWVLQTAAGMLDRLHVAGFPSINVSVNVSAKQIGHPALLTHLELLLAKAKFQAHQLELEMTESSVISNRSDARAAMAQFKQMGVRLSVDDLGTGYSSLEYIKDWPIDCIKIDRIFVQGVPRDASDMAITQAIAQMGRALGLRVVAEGVERAEQLDCLRDLGCDEYQGFLVSAALPENELLALLRTWHRDSGSLQAEVLEPMGAPTSAC